MTYSEELLALLPYRGYQIYILKIHGVTSYEPPVAFFAVLKTRIEKDQKRIDKLVPTPTQEDPYALRNQFWPARYYSDKPSKEVTPVRQKPGIEIITSPVSQDDLFQHFIDTCKYEIDEILGILPFPNTYPRVPWRSPNGKTINLITPAELNSLPDEIMLHAIDGTTVTKGKDPIDEDPRIQFVAYGFPNRPLIL